MNHPVQEILHAVEPSMSEGQFLVASFLATLFVLWALYEMTKK